MSYYVIKGPGAFSQYLCEMPGFGCPQWWHSRAKARRFPDAEGAHKWVADVQKTYTDHGTYAGRVVRVNTVKDWKAERARLLAEIERLRAR